MSTARSAPVSVVIPAHNRAHTIVRCIKSVLEQTLPPAEVIVVDDGSGDDTAAVASACGGTRVRVLRLEKCQGAQNARNHGVEAATQDWIAFQDSDDEWLPNKLQMEWARLNAHPGDSSVVVHCDCLVDNGVQRTVMKPPLVDGSEAYRTVLSCPSPMFPGLLVSRATLIAVGMLDAKVPSYQEWDTAIRLAKVSQFVHVREPLFIYHRHGGPTISDSQARDHAGYEYVITKYQSEILRVAGESVWNRHLLRQAIVATSIGDKRYLEALPGRFLGSSKSMLSAVLWLVLLQQKLATTIGERVLDWARCLA